MLKEIGKNKSYEGYKLKQLKRTGNICIYQVDSGTHFEVVKLRLETPSEAYLKQGFLKEEKYPRSEQWGRYGFTYKDLESATKKFNELIP